MNCVEAYTALEAVKRLLTEKTVVVSNNQFLTLEIKFDSYIKLLLIDRFPDAVILNECSEQEIYDILRK